LGQRFSKLVLEKVVTCPYVPGALEFIEKYANVFPLFIASGTPEDELEEILERRKIKDYFRETHGTPKGKPQIITDILERYDLDPHTMPFVGDAMNDYLAAAQAGIPFYGRVPLDLVNPFPLEIKVFPDLTELEYSMGLNQ
jgi:phosphoglycolate phosphatase-like HAD superfamily hydrolase